MRRRQETAVLINKDFCCNVVGWLDSFLLPPLRELSYSFVFCPGTRNKEIVNVYANGHQQPTMNNTTNKSNAFDNLVQTTIVDLACLVT